MHPPLIYTALGDSLTVGVGAIMQSGLMKNYTKLSEYALKRKIVTNKFAKRKITSYEFIHYLTDPNVRNSIYHANLITITIGGNDLIQANRHFQKTNDTIVFNQALKSLKYHFETLLLTVHEIKKHTNKPFLIRVVGLYNPSPHIPYSHYWVSQFNHTLTEITSAYGGKFVDIYPIFKKFGHRLLTIDRLHPNSSGYNMIAQELYRSGYDELFHIK